MFRPLTIICLVLYATPLLAERVVFVDPKHGYIIIDKLPGEIQPFPADRLCLLAKNGFIFTCEAVVLVNNKRLAVKLPPQIIRLHPIESNQVILVKNIFVMQQGTFNAQQSSARFNPALQRQEDMDKSLIELATKQEKLLARLLPIAQPSESKGEGSPSKQDPGISSLPLQKEKRFGKVEGAIDSKEPREAYDPEFVEYMKKIEQNMTKLPDLSRLKVRYTIKDGKLKKIPRTKKFTIQNENVARLKNRYRGPLKHTEISLVRLENIVSTFSYNALGFNPVGEESQRSSLWKASSKVTRGNGGIGLNLTFLIGSHSFITLGGYYNIFNKQSQKSFLFENRSDQQVTTSTEASSFGFSTDYGWSFFADGPYDLELISGLGLENSSIDFKAIRKSQLETGDSEIIGYGQSTLNAVNLRLGFTNRLFIGNLNVFLGFIAHVPIYKINSSFDGEVSVPEGLGLETTGEEDLEKSLDHRMNEYGADVSLGISYRF